MDPAGFPRGPPGNVTLLRSQAPLSAFVPQVHIQTIGILVSEKTELQTALAHTQQAARQKAGGNLGAL